ncbi:O-antigen ligase [Neorhizobium galegae]|uniref:O-antigen ligase family protein n=1 Tax=Neorhizobium galegae TaxID=399 RepID=UPI0012786963|nr:O-antigen ligase family protein [Neorhizobium galegae]KAA9388584.1 O-antigen ligase family protein [Neorhizobium galegae]KAB1114022.1 O-antigen ligase family protein [Neorhizobium galegae]MCM2500975.1 O-antigen ligase family protein [Neorhizobium galegae]MCQ1771023.1 O-antigen ligase family protein [Neorhizobium galegae]MCQ1780114.1 O-antigen ligase family protein [Neorhizobium galegae]
MPEFLRSLAYVLIVTVPVLYVGGKIAVPIIGLAEFRLWRNCWLLATVVTFLSRGFFDFAVAMAFVSFYVHRYSKQPAFFYIVLMFVAPCVPIPSGIPGIFNKILDLDPPRWLAVTILLPVALRLWRDQGTRELRGLDVIVIAFLAYTSLLSVRLGDFNAILRVLAVNFLDICLPYFVFSRAIRTSLDMNKALLAFVVGVLPLSAIGVLEISKSWRVYYVVVQEWDVFLVTAYLFRDGLLRASTTSIEAIAFGFACMTGAGCLLALRSPVSLGNWRYVALGILVLGLLSSVSRGPWLGFAFCILFLTITSPKKSFRLALAGLPGVAALLFLHPPFLDRFINLLPFVGSADKSSETYRSSLFENSLVVIQRYPLFGSDSFLKEPEMQTMIQGQGIIDIVNTYLQIALYYGLIGLFIFVLYFSVISAKLSIKSFGEDLGSLNYKAVLGLLVAMLLVIVTTSSVSVIPYIYWTFSAMGAAILAPNFAGSRESLPLQVTKRLKVIGLHSLARRDSQDDGRKKMRVLSMR